MSRNKDVMSFGNTNNVGMGKISIDDSDSDEIKEEAKDQGNNTEKINVGGWGKPGAAATTKRPLVSFSEIEKKETEKLQEADEPPPKPQRSSSYQAPAEQQRERVQRQHPAMALGQGQQQQQRSAYDYEGANEELAQQRKGFSNIGSRHQRDYNDNYSYDNHQDDYNQYPKSYSRDFVVGGGGGGGSGYGRNQRRNPYYDSGEDSGYSNRNNNNYGNRGGYQTKTIQFGKQHQSNPGALQNQTQYEEFQPDDDQNNRGYNNGIRLGSGRRQQPQPNQQQNNWNQDNNNRRGNFNFGANQQQWQHQSDGIAASHSYSNDRTTGPARSQQNIRIAIGSKQTQPEVEVNEWRPND